MKSDQRLITKSNNLEVSTFVKAKFDVVVINFVNKLNKAKKKKNTHHL